MNLPFLTSINLIGVFMLSIFLFNLSDTGVGVYITYKYEDIDGPTFQHFLTPMQIHILINVVLFLFIFFVLWRFFTIYLRPREIEEDKNVEGEEDMEASKGVGEIQNGESNQSCKESQEMDEDDNQVNETPRKFTPLAEIHMSPQTPMLSSVLNAQHTPRPPIKTTIGNKLRPSTQAFFQSKAPTLAHPADSSPGYAEFFTTPGTSKRK